RGGHRTPTSARRCSWWCCGGKSRRLCPAGPPRGKSAPWRSGCSPWLPDHLARPKHTKFHLRGNSSLCGADYRFTPSTVFKEREEYYWNPEAWLEDWKKRQGR